MSSTPTIATKRPKNCRNQKHDESNDKPREIELSRVANYYKKLHKLNKRSLALRKKVRGIEPVLIQSIQNIGSDIALDDVSISIKDKRRSKRPKFDDVQRDLIYIIKKIKSHSKQKKLHSNESNSESEDDDYDDFMLNDKIRNKNYALLAQQIYNLCTQPIVSTTIPSITAHVQDNDDLSDDMLSDA